MPKNYYAEKSKMRFQALTDEEAAQGVIAADIAKETEIGVGTYSNYYNRGLLSTKGANLIKLAQYFDVSVDYLLGLVDIPSASITDREICSLTGLTQPALSNIRYCLEDDDKYKHDGISDREILNTLFASDEFRILMQQLLQAFRDSLGNYKIQKALDYDIFSDVFLNGVLEAPHEKLSTVLKEAPEHDSEDNQSTYEIRKQILLDRQPTEKKAERYSYFEMSDQFATVFSGLKETYCKRIDNVIKKFLKQRKGN